MFPEPAEYRNFTNNTLTTYSLLAVYKSPDSDRYVRYINTNMDYVCSTSKFTDYRSFINDTVKISHESEYYKN